MTMQTTEGQKLAEDTVVLLARADELEKRSAVDADTYWRMLAAHLRSKHPQALMSLEQVP